jgi:hypothetical protein
MTIVRADNAMEIIVWAIVMVLWAVGQILNQAAKQKRQQAAGTSGAGQEQAADEGGEGGAPESLREFLEQLAGEPPPPPRGPPPPPDPSFDRPAPEIAFEKTRQGRSSDDRKNVMPRTMEQAARTARTEWQRQRDIQKQQMQETRRRLADQTKAMRPSFSGGSSGPAPAGPSRLRREIRPDRPLEDIFSEERAKKKAARGQMTQLRSIPAMKSANVSPIKTVGMSAIGMKSFGSRSSLDADHVSRGPRVRIRSPKDLRRAMLHRFVLGPPKSLEANVDPLRSAM